MGIRSNLRENARIPRPPPPGDQPDFVPSWNYSLLSMSKLTVKSLSILLSGFLSFNLDGQSLTGPATVASYNAAQKQLLVRNTAQFLQLLNQGSLDRDTAMLVACKTTEIPFLTAVAYDPDSLYHSPAADWI